MAVQEQIYRGGGDVSPAAALPTASPAAFGAGIGEALEGAGDEIESSSLRAMRADKERQQQSDNAQAALGAAQLKVGLTEFTQAARDDAPIDGAGHVDRVSAGADKQINDFLGTIKDPRVRQHWAAQTADMKAGLVVDEEGWARGRRVSSIGTNANEANRLWSNSLQSNPTPDAFQDALKAGDTFWSGAQVDAATREKGKREWNSDVAKNYSTGLIEKDPASALVLLQSGALDLWLDSDNKKALIDNAESGVRIALADARRAHSQAEAQVREDIGEYKERVDRGELPSDDDTKTLVGRAQALGLTNLVDDVNYSSGKLKMSRETDKWTSAEWEHNVNALAEKVARGKSSPEEQMQLRILQELRGPKEARFKNDPDGYAAASGMSPPQVDIAAPDAGAVQARKSWARGFAHSGGLVEPPYLNKDQLQVYRDRAAQGPVGQLEVASDLRNTWGMDAAPSIVRQIGGDAKADMQIMLGLNDRMAQVYRRGAEALAKKSTKLNDTVARQVWSTFANGVPPDMRPALFDAASNIAAGWMSEQGRTEPTADFADVFGKAVHRAAGMLGSWGEGSATGGFARWNGRYAWLPQDMTRTDFQARISRAQPGDWNKAAVDGAGNATASAPYHLGPDGKRVAYSADEIRRFGHGTLQTVAPGIYQLVDPAGGLVVDEHGRPWQFDVRRLPRGHFGGSR
jgi:hypothetical protein